MLSLGSVLLSIWSVGRWHTLLHTLCSALFCFAACCVLHAVCWPGDGADGRDSGPGDLELAVSCWWRAAALQALSAFVMGIMGKGLAEDAAQQVRGFEHCVCNNVPWLV
jgi:hypothetical protein